jgi:hypothetical protein
MVKYIIQLLFVFIVLSACHDKNNELDNSLSFEKIKKDITEANNGDIVYIPAGTCLINQQIEFRNSITIIGAGIDKTIFMAQSDSSGLKSILRSLDANNVRISGITFNMNNKNKNCGINLMGAHRDFRIDHCKFTESTRNGLPIIFDGWRGNFSGVVDHCLFYNDRAEEITYYGDDDDAWTRPPYLGMDINNFASPRYGVVFVEDCTFKYDQDWCEKNKPAEHAICSNDGSRYVFRYNTVDVGYAYVDGQANMMGSVVDAHGNYNNDRGSFSFEVYENTIKSAHSYRAFNFRGGSGVVFNNHLTGEFTYQLNFLEYKAFNPPAKPSHGNQCEHGYCAMACPDHTSPVPPIAPDQINNVYIWGNTYNGSESAFLINVDDVGHNRYCIQKDRDYFDFAMPGYIPFTYPHPLNLE